MTLTVARVFVADAARRRLNTERLRGPPVKEAGAVVDRVVDTGARTRVVDAEAGALLRIYIGCHYHPGIPVGALDLAHIAN